MTKETLFPFRFARYRPYPMVILSGLLLALSFPPLPFAFLSYIAFVPLLLVIDRTPDKLFEDRFWGFFKAIFVLIWRFITLQFLWRYKQKPWIYKRQIISHNAQVFRYAYTTFVIWNLGTCYWLMMTAFGADSWQEVLTYIMSGLVANLVNPFLMTIPIYLFSLSRRTGWSWLPPVSLVVFWLTFEFLHFNWDLSWSWITLGHAFTLFPKAIQYIELTGTLGISLQILMINVLVFSGLKVWEQAHQSGFTEMRKLALASLSTAVVALLTLPFIANIWLLNPERDVFQSVGNINVRVIQPNIDPYEKTSSYGSQIAIMDSLIGSAGIDSIDLVLMPETAISKGMYQQCLREERLIQPFWQQVYLHNLSLMSGFIEFRLYPKDSNPVPVHTYQFVDNRVPSRCLNYPEAFDTIYLDQNNASFLLRTDTVPQTFQKAKLVPMVERMPFLDVLTFLKDWAPALGGSVGGYGYPDSVRNLVLHTHDKVAPMLCYESEYGDYLRQFVAKGARFMTIITNDGWWGESSGHIQHAHFASLRAIETRRAIARSANTGISLFTDNKGEISQPTDFWVPTFIDGKLDLYDSQTFYVKHGDYLGYIAAGLSLLLLLLILIRNSRFGRTHKG